MPYHSCYASTCSPKIQTGLNFCKMNIHLLSHLTYYVRLFGPLWTHSAFSFEDCIGHLLQKSHGTHDIANQVYRCSYTIIVLFKPHFLQIVTSYLLQWRLQREKKMVQAPLELTAFLHKLRTGIRLVQIFLAPSPSVKCT